MWKSLPRLNEKELRLVPLSREKTKSIRRFGTLALAGSARGFRRKRKSAKSVDEL
jgi:hypothetical protein